MNAQVNISLLDVMMCFASNFLLVLSTSSHSQDRKCFRMEEGSQYRRAICSALRNRIFTFFI